MPAHFAIPSSARRSILKTIGGLFAAAFFGLSLPQAQALPSGVASGSGTEADPYILAGGGGFAVSENNVYYTASPGASLAYTTFYMGGNNVHLVLTTTGTSITADTDFELGRSEGDMVYLEIANGAELKPTSASFFGYRGVAAIDLHDGGKLTTAQFTRVGYSGVTTVTMSRGAVWNQGGVLSIGYGSSGTVGLTDSGTYLSAGSTIEIGSGVGGGTLRISNGALVVAGGAGPALQTGSNGTIQLDGGYLAIKSASQLSVPTLLASTIKVNSDSGYVAGSSSNLATRYIPDAAAWSTDPLYATYNPLGVDLAGYTLVYAKTEARWGVAGPGDDAPSSWAGRGDLADAMTYANGLGSGTAYIQLLSDVAPTAPLSFATGKTTILDLNGNDIDRGLSVATDAGNVLTIDGTLTLKDGSTTNVANQGRITGGYNTYSSGGGVFVNTSASFILQGGNITGNRTNSESFGGGGVLLGGIASVGGNGDTGSRSFVMTGGSIAGNEAKGWGGGVAVYVGNFTMLGGSITGNKSANGGVFFDPRSAGEGMTGTLTVGGTAVIENNQTTSATPVERNIYSSGSGKLITVSTATPLTTGASIGFTAYTAPTSASPVAITGANSADYSGYFTSDRGDYQVRNSGSGNAQVVQLAVAAPAVTSPTSAEVTDTTATLGGTVTSTGGQTLTARGVVYAQTALDNEPRLDDTYAAPNSVVTDTGSGGFTASITGLTPGTAYSYAAYATNATGTSYSATGSFTTAAATAVTGVTSTTADGFYKAGDAISIQVTFSRPVTVYGNQATLTLGNGGTANYTGGSGSATLTFTYTVQAGDAAADLDYASTGALVLPSGNFIRNQAVEYDAVLTLPAPGAVGSLGANAAIVLDTTAPDTAITAHPAALANSTAATFTFTGTDGTGVAGFEASLDGGAFAAASSPASYSGLSEGSHTWCVRAVDAAGNVDATPAVYAWAIDATAPAAPSVIAPLPAAVLADSTPLVTGTAEAGSTVALHVGGGPAVGTVTADGAGSWSYTFASALAEGTYSLTATATDAAGNTSVPSAAVSFSIDTVAPAAPAVAAAGTNLITGWAEAGSTVTVSVSGSVAGTGLADDTTGAWTCVPGTPLVAGTTYDITAVAADAAGNESVPSAVFTVTIAASGSTWVVMTAADEVAAPAAGSLRYAMNNAVSGDTVVFALPSGSETISLAAELSLSGKALLIDGRNATITGGSGTAVAITVPGASPYRALFLDPGSTGTVTLRNLTIRGGNPGDGSGGVLFCSSGTVALESVTVCEGQASSGGGIFVVGTATLTNCTVSGNTASLSGGGLYVMGMATLTNCTVSGNTAPYGGGLFVDIGGVPKLLNSLVVANNSPYDIKGYGTIYAYGCWYGTVQGVTIPNDSFFPNVTTGYTAGDLQPLADNGGPTRTHALAANAPAVGAGVAVYYSATNDFYYLRASNADGSFTYYLVPLSGMLSPFGSSLANPAADRIASDQRGVTRLTPPDIGAYQTVRIGSVGAPAAGAYVTGTALTFTLNLNAPVTVDTTGGTPRLALTVGTATRYATYVSGSGTTSLVFTYTVQAGDNAADGLAVAGAIDLNGGTITDATGQALNATLPSFTLPVILVDTTAPETTLSTTPAALSTSDMATFAFSGDDGAGSGVSSFEASVDGAAYAVATSPLALSGLAEGTHTFAVRAIDAAGNLDATPASYTWTVDTTAPSTPTGLVGTATAPSTIVLSWAASTDAVGVAGYRIYRAGTAIGTSSTTSYSDAGLTAGTAYTYTVTAYDAAGHESAASAPVTATTQYAGPQSLAVGSTSELVAALATIATNPSANYTLTLAAGTYRPATGLTLAGDQVTLHGDGTVVFDGSALSAGALLTVTGDQVVIHGVTFRQAPAAALAIAAGATAGTVADCTFEGAGISGTACPGWTITGNAFNDLVGSSASAAAAITFGAGADDLTITDNVILDCDRGIALTASAGAQARNNFIADNRTSGHPGAAIALVEVTGAQIDHNTLYAAGGYANAIEYSGGAIGAIRNNLTNKPITATDTATTTLATNVATAQASWFKDPSAGDLHLTSTRSGVVDAGTAIAGFSVDIDGDARPTGSAADIGADEFQPDTVAPTTPTNLGAQATANGAVTLGWTASTDSAPAGAAVSGVAGYRIYRNGTAVGTTTATSYTDTGLAPGTAYSYTVTAFDGAANESARSTAANVTTAGSGDTGGGKRRRGGGAPSLWFLFALGVAGALRLRAQRRP